MVGNDIWSAELGLKGKMAPVLNIMQGRACRADDQVLSLTVQSKFVQQNHSLVLFLCELITKMGFHNTLTKCITVMNVNH